MFFIKENEVSLEMSRARSWVACSARPPWGPLTYLGQGSNLTREPKAVTLHMYFRMNWEKLEWESLRGDQNIPGKGQEEPDLGSRNRNSKREICVKILLPFAMGYLVLTPFFCSQRLSLPHHLYL